MALNVPSSSPPIEVSMVFAPCAASSSARTDAGKSVSQSCVNLFQFLVMFVSARACVPSSCSKRYATLVFPFPLLGSPLLAGPNSVCGVLPVLELLVPLSLFFLFVLNDDDWPDDSLTSLLSCCVVAVCWAAEAAPDVPDEAIFPLKVLCSPAVPVGAFPVDSDSEVPGEAAALMSLWLCCVPDKSMLCP